MADSTQNKGFTIPAPAPAKGQPAVVPMTTPMTTSQQIAIVPPIGVVIDSTQPRDYAIAGGVLLVLIIAFFFAKKAYSNHLALKRISSGSANAAGWWLFIFLTGLATAAVLSVLNSAKFLSPMFMVPLLVISLVALILMFITGRRT
jgi:hypothetical protein